MRTITATMPAWLTNEYTSPETLETGDQQDVGELLWYCALANTPDGWVQVGKATITVELIDRNELINNKANAIRAEIQKTRADAVVKENKLTEQLNSLLAITYKPEA